MDGSKPPEPPVHPSLVMYSSDFLLEQRAVYINQLNQTSLDKAAVHKIVQTILYIDARAPYLKARRLIGEP